MFIRWDYIHDLENQSRGRPPIHDVVYNGEIIDELANYKNGREHQRLIIFQYNQYLYVAPYVYDDKFWGIFIKTLYPDGDLMRERYHNHFTF